MNVKLHEFVTLADYLDQCAARPDGEALNTLKFRILYLFKLAEQGRLPPFSPDDILIDPNALIPVINFFSATDHRPDPGREYTRLNSLYTRKKLFFIKPGRKALSEAASEKLRTLFMDWVLEKLVPLKCIAKIYTIGSTMSARAERYTVPFVHFDWVKLSSDFNLFLEIEPDYENDIPKEWRKKFSYLPTGSIYYHFDELGNGMDSEHARRFPEVPCYEHLVEGYVFFPSQGNVKRKNDFLRQVDAKLVFARPGLSEWLESSYGVRPDSVSRFRAASFNKVYKVASGGDKFALKVYVAKYMSEKRRNKVSYEVALLNALRASGLRLAFPVKNSAGEYISLKDGNQAVLFTYLDGKYVPQPTEKQIRAAGALLARLHDKARNHYIVQQGAFGNKDKLFYWIKAWDQYNKEGVQEIALPLDTGHYMERLKKLDTFATHCHGDLSPINFIYAGDDCGLIDFQDAGYGPALIDLANAMVEFAAQQQNFLFDNLKALRAGYESVRKLSLEERGYLRDLLIIKILTRQSSLLRLHFGGYGYALKTERLLGLRKGLEALLGDEPEL